MSFEPLKNLIEEKGFEKYQSEIRFQLAAYGLKHTTFYSKHTNRSAIYLDFESQTQLGRITAWISGECEMEVLDVETEATVFCKSYCLKSEKEFLQKILILGVFMGNSSL